MWELWNFIRKSLKTSEALIQKEKKQSYWKFSYPESHLTIFFYRKLPKFYILLQKKVETPDNTPDSQDILL